MAWKQPLEGSKQDLIHIKWSKITQLALFPQPKFLYMWMLGQITNNKDETK
jgi:hypothetical protein